MQQVNPSHERQKSTRDKTERSLEKRGQISVILFVYRAFKTGKDLQEIDCYTSRHDSKRIDS